MKLSELAKHVSTDTARILRDCEVESAELCAAVRGPNAVTYLEKEKFLPSLEQTGIAAVICTEELADRLPSHIRGVLISDAPKFAFYLIHNALAKQKPVLKIPANISETAEISPDAIVSAWNVEIGDGVIVEPGAVIGEHVSIGSGTRICARAVIGARSFNPARYKTRTVTMEDCGRIVIGSDVLICSQAVVVRGVLMGEVTEIGSGTKIDTFVHVAHGAYIGLRTFVASGAILGGNCQIGQDVWIGINATIRNRVHIGSAARVSMGAAVTKDVTAGQTVSGNFAIDHRRFLQNLKVSLGKDVSSIEKQTPPPRRQSEKSNLSCVLRDSRREAA